MDSSSDRPIVYLANSDEIGGEIVRALGLRDVVEFSLVFKGGAPVQVVAVLDVREADGEKIVRQLTTRRYHLQPVDGDLASMPVREAIAGEVDRMAAGEG